MNEIPRAWGSKLLEPPDETPGAWGTKHLEVGGRNTWRSSALRVVYEYSHLRGSEILQVRYPNCERDIYEIIAGVQARRTKVSREKTMRGQALYSPKDMNRQFRVAFSARGYRVILIGVDEPAPQ